MTAPLIIVVSNRNVNPGQPDHELFGEQHNSAGWDQLRVATAEFDGRWKLHLLDDDQGQSPPPTKHLFDDVIRRVQEGRIPNKFVFFVHGNNQTTLKNLNKARKLATIHGVNVIAFSWPSRPKGGSKQSRFRQAQINAVKTAPALEVAFRVLSEYTSSCSLFIELNLLVHSLGNLLFKAYTEGFSPNIGDQLFRTAMLHQGSPPNENHHTWVDQIDISRTTYLTINSRDNVLYWAEKIDPDTIGRNRKNLLAANTIYIDFTGGENVGDKHQIFGIRDGAVYEVIQKAITGLDPELGQAFYFDESHNAWLVKNPETLREFAGAEYDPLDNRNPDYDPEFDEKEDEYLENAYPGLLK